LDKYSINLSIQILKKFIFEIIINNNNNFFIEINQNYGYDKEEIDEVINLPDVVHKKKETNRPKLKELLEIKNKVYT